MTQTTLKSPVISNPYKFSVYRNAAQNSGSAAFAIINFDAALFDTGSNVDIVTNKGRFTAPVTGYYQLSASVSVAASVTLFIIALYKNGSEFSRGTKLSGTQSNGAGAVVSELVYLTAGQYVEVYCYANTATALEVGASAPHPVFSGFLVCTT